MKAIINSQVLLTALQTVGKVISKTVHVPIIENFLFDIRNQVLTVSATDLYNTFKLSWRIECRPETQFQAVVPKEVIKYLQKLDEPIVITYNPETYSIELTEAGARAKYSGENPQDFPVPPQTNSELFETTSDMFMEFKDLLNYCSSDEVRPAMTGIGMIQRGGLNLVGTNGHILKVVNLPEIDMPGDEEGNILILPAKAAKILSDLKFGTAKKPERQTVFVCGGYTELMDDDGKPLDKKRLDNVSFLFSYGVFDAELISRVIDERYPQYWAVIPETSVTQYTTEKKRFLSVLDKAQLFANRTTKQVRLSLNGSNKISAEDLDFSNEYCAEVGGSYSGEPIEIGFNAELLKDVVNSFGEEFTLEMIAPNKAAVIRSGNTLALCMPVMLTQYE